MTNNNLSAQLQIFNNSLDELHIQSKISNKNLNTLNELLTTNQQQLNANQELSKTTNQNLNQLTIAVRAIISLDTQLVYVNKKLQIQTDSLIKQTKLLSESVGLSEESLMKNKHKDSVEFLLQSYDLQVIIDSVEANSIYIYQNTDSLTAINFVNKEIIFLTLGFRNYCINDDNILYTRWKRALGIVSSVKYDVNRGYPNVKYTADFLELKKDPKKETLYYTMDVIQSDQSGFSEIIKSVKEYLLLVQGSYINSFENMKLGLPGSP